MRMRRTPSGPVAAGIVCWATAAVVLGACAKPRLVVLPPPIPAVPGYTEKGEASWYGHPYHGRRAASGEVYDMMEMTAAHRALPFGTWLLVENLDNGRTVEVRVNDRGPFVDGRIIDLSYAAARLLDAVGPGVIPVRLRVIGSTPASSAQGTVFSVQVGAFVEEGHARALQRDLGAAGAGAVVVRADVGDRTFWRVRSGRFSTRAEAEREARRLARLGHAVLVVTE